MSISKVSDIMEYLPYTLRDQIISYVRSVHAAMPEIFEDAGLELDGEISDQILVIATLKRLYSICSSAFWTIENSLHKLAVDSIPAVKIGSTHYARGSEAYNNLRVLLNEFDKFLGQEDLGDYIKIFSYSEIARLLTNGR